MEQTTLPNPQSITDLELINKINKLYKTIDLANPDLEKVYSVLEDYAEYLVNQGLDKSMDIELYTPILVDSVILKARICERTKTTIKFDYSMFHIDDNGQTQEHYIDSKHVKTQDLAVVFKRIFTSVKCFLVFNKFDLESNTELDMFEFDDPFVTVMSAHYKKHTPVSYS